MEGVSSKAKSKIYKLQFELKGHRGPVYAICCDENYIYSSGSDCFVTRWNISAGQQDDFVIQLKNPAYSILCGQFSKQVIILDTKGILYIVDSETKKIQQAVQLTDKKVFCARLFLDENRICVSNESGDIYLYDIALKKIVRQTKLGHDKNRKFILREDLKKLFFPMGNGALYVLDSLSFDVLHFYRVSEAALSAICYDETQEFLYLGNKNAHLSRFNLFTESIESSIPAHNYVIYDILKIEEFGITCSRDKTIKIWNSDFSEVLQRIDFKSGGHRFSVNQLIKLNNGAFASCSDDGLIKVFQKV